MHIYADPGPAPDAARGASVALGNFDGVHRGHQAVIGVARKQGGPLAAAVFEPHPRSVFRPDDPPFRLQSPGQRARALEALGVETVFEIHFDKALAQLSDEEFARTQLHERFGAKHVTVGFDFTFGRGRMGNAQSLKALGEKLGFGVSIVEPVSEPGTSGPGSPKISSSAIRAAIADGRMEDAANLLSRPWAIEGFVGPGAARGRTIGFPTANVGLGVYARPKFGVYAVRVEVDGATHNGVANCGVKPTVGGAAEPLLEIHLFDFDRDIYGRKIEAQMLHFIRPEKKFENFDALKAQIADDAKAAREMLR